ncbi:MAG: Rrf2 family transcriptional regulator [bacterium]|nr:Rrf2 family transcriptional regulator [bacterium]
MRISNEIDYGLRAMVVIASHQEKLLSSKEISRQYCIPYNFLTLILPRLVKAQLIVSHQGPKGGYQLNRKPDKIPVIDIISALGTPIEITPCNTEKGCKLAEICSLSKIWIELNKQIDSYLLGVTLDQIMLDSEKLKLIQKIGEQEPVCRF